MSSMLMVVTAAGSAACAGRTESGSSAGSQAGNTAIEVEGIRSVTFFLGVPEIVHEERTLRGSYTSIQPAIEHVREYLRFNFPFVVASARGDPPPDSPGLPDFDEVYGD